ncbi:unnamed protein product, partial [Mesorhabditis spiculigera]
MRAFSSLASSMKVAIVGEGVVGLSTALTVRERHPNAKINIISDRKFEQACSYGPAGLFRIDAPKNKEYGRVTFHRFEELCKKYPGSRTGLKLLSGHIQSDDKERLASQEKSMGDIVYNFRWLTQREIDGMWENPNKYVIHYTAYASEGSIYVPFLKSLCLDKGINFEHRPIKKIDELGNEYEVVFNCAGIDGGKLAGDDDTMVPSRGVVLEVEAPWHKHFNYRNFDTFTIPKNNTVAIGTVKVMGDGRLEITQADRDDIMARYLKLHSAMKDAKVVKEWVGLRPERPAGVRIERQQRETPSGQKFTVVHNYGHGPNGFTLSWGTAQAAAKLIEDLTSTRSKL